MSKSGGRDLRVKRSPDVMMALAIKRRVECSLLAHAGLVFVQVKLFEDDFGFPCDGFSVEFLIPREGFDMRQRERRRVLSGNCCRVVRASIEH